jgi:hypothetical protein
MVSSRWRGRVARHTVSIRRSARHVMDMEHQRQSRPQTTVSSSSSSSSRALLSSASSSRSLSSFSSPLAQCFLDSTIAPSVTRATTSRRLMADTAILERHIHDAILAMETQDKMAQRLQCLWRGHLARSTCCRVRQVHR